MSKLFRSFPKTNKSVNFFAEKSTYTFEVDNAALNSAPSVHEIILNQGTTVGLITSIEIERGLDSPQASYLLSLYNDISLSANSLSNVEELAAVESKIFTTTSFSPSANALYLVCESNNNGGVNATAISYVLTVELLQFNGELSAQTLQANYSLLNTANFDRNLSAGDTNLQLALQTLNDKDSLNSISITLSSDYSISLDSPKILYINPNNSNRVVNLNQEWNGYIINSSDDGSFSLQLHDGTDIIEEMGIASNIKSALVFYDTSSNEYVIKQTAKFINSSSINPTSAAQISLDTTNFDKNLSVSDINLQLALQTLDEALSNTNSASLNFTSNSSQLSSNITLTKQSSYFQIHNPLSSDHIITLDLEWIGQIINDGDGTHSLLLQNPSSNSIIAELSPATNLKAVLLWYDTNLSQFIVQQTALWQANNVASSSSSSSSGSSLTQTQKTLLKLALKRGT